MHTPILLTSLGFPLMDENLHDIVEASKEVIWMKEFIGELRMERDHFLLHCDKLSMCHPPCKECALPLLYQTYLEEISLVQREGWWKGIFPCKDPYERQWIWPNYCQCTSWKHVNWRSTWLTSPYKGEGGVCCEEEVHPNGRRSYPALDASLR